MDRQMLGRLAPLGLLAAALLAPTNAHAGLGEALERMREGVQTTTGRLQGGFVTTRERLAEGITVTAEQLNAGLSAAGEQLGTALQISAGRLRRQYLMPTEGTESFEFQLRHQGLERNVRVIRPLGDASTPAPVIVLLHFSNGTNELMANLVRAGQLAADSGVWVVMPDARNGKWNDDPESLGLIDDVGFLDAVIAQIKSDYPVDPHRIYMAGMSNGGFMAGRYACERPQTSAAFASVAAAMRRSLDRACSPASTVPAMFVLGTSDLIVPYDAEYGLLSAERTFARWAGINQCGAAVTHSELPDLVDDDTRIALDETGACAGGSTVRLYTVEGGGHAWPGGESFIPFPALGRTSQDLDLSADLWTYFRNFSR